MRSDELDYDLPADRIATRPSEPRDAARLMVVSHQGEVIEHARVRDLPQYVQAGDCMVFNNTAVCPARLVGRRADTGGRVEGLFLEMVSARQGRCLFKSNGKLRPGQVLALVNAQQDVTGDELVLIDRSDEAWIVEPRANESLESVLDRSGHTPLPPYILKARDETPLDVDSLDRLWYQTVYADLARRRSVAAPTAGLHFTDELLHRIDAAGISRTELTLHVGAGTFQPIKTETLDAHVMHREWFEVSRTSIEKILNTRAAGGRIIAVGTTTVRTLESLPPAGELCDRDLTGSTELLIAPPYRFRLVDGLMTNFHLPRSTLLALVGAMVGLERLKSLYAEAVGLGYRFYSYGDAMLILPRKSG